VAQAVQRVLAVAFGNKLCWFESHYRHISLYGPGSWTCASSSLQKQTMLVRVPYCRCSAAVTMVRMRAQFVDSVTRHWHNLQTFEQFLRIVLCLLFKKIENSAARKNPITTFGWEQFDHPHYSPDLAPGDCHLFLHLKFFVAGPWFHDDDVKAAVTCFASQAASFYDEGGQKLVQCYEKCLNNSRNYVKK